MIGGNDSLMRLPGHIGIGGGGDWTLYLIYDTNIFKSLNIPLFIWVLKIHAIQIIIFFFFSRTYIFGAKAYSYE